MARSQVQQLFQASLESHTSVDEAAFAGGIESMEAAMLSVEEGRQEMDSANTDVDEMVEIAEGLESIVVAVEATQEDGGLDARSAQMMQLAVGGYTSRLGLEAADVTPSLEAFGGDSGRLSATTVSVEEIGKTVRNIWNAIKQAIQRAIKATADFFAKIFGGVDKVISRIDAMEKQVKDLKGTASGKMSVSGAQFLHVGGKVEAGDILTGLKTLDSVAAMAYGDYLKSAEDYYKTVADKFKDGGLQKAEDESKADAAAAETDVAAEKAGAKLEAWKTKEFSGGKVFHAEGEKTIPAMADGTKAPQGAVEIGVPSTSELESILKTSKAIAERIKGAKDNQARFAKAREDAMKEAEGFVKSAEGNRLGKAWSQAKANVLLRKAQRDLTRPVSQVTSHSFSSVRAALGLVEAAVKQYGGDKKDDKKDAAAAE
jgi:hypothetical protein